MLPKEVTPNIVDSMAAMSIPMTKLQKSSPILGFGMVKHFGHMNGSGSQYVSKKDLFRQLSHLSQTANLEFDESKETEYKTAGDPGENDESEDDCCCNIKLWSMYDLPHWYHTYGKILNGYRYELYNMSVCQAIKSLFQIHNETMNIWTEYLPFIIEITLLVYLCVFEPDFIANHGLHTQIIIPLCLFIALFRAVISGTAHLFHCMNAEISRYCWNMDYISIILYSASGAIIWSHFLFYCNFNQQIICMVGIVVLALSSIVSVVWAAKDELREISLMLVIVYNNIVLLGYLIISYILSITDIPAIFILYWIIAILIGGLAAFIRAKEFPERQCVERCFKAKIKTNFPTSSTRNVEQQMVTHLPDISIETKSKWYYYIFTSHNWWHILIHCSSITVICTFREFLLWRSKHECQ